jgi:hypothetical protein
MHPRNRRRFLRPALALLGHAGTAPPRHAHPLQHQPEPEGRRRRLPPALRSGKGRRDPAGRRQLAPWVGDRGRLPRIHLRRAAETGLGRRPDARGTGHHPAHRRQRPREPDGKVSWSIDLSGGIQRVARARLRALRQRQGPRGRLEPARPDPGAPRADLFAAPDLVADYPTRDDGRQFRMPNIGKTMQTAVEKSWPRSSRSS